MWDKELPKKKKTFQPILILVLGLVVFVVCGALWGFYQMLVPPQSGSGNVLNYSYVAACRDDIYFVNPGDERLIRLGDGSIQTVTETGAMYLTCVEDDLYYVSTETGYFMRYAENAEDEVILDYGCNNPIYWEGTLYFYSGLESHVYAVSVSDGVFGDPVCVHEDIRVVSFSIDNGYMYYIPAVGVGLWRWRLNSTEAPQKISDSFCAQPVAKDKKVYFIVMDDTASGIYVMDQNGKQTCLVETQASCLNVCDGWVYYTNLSEEAGGAIYKCRTHGKRKPEKATCELGADIQIVAGHVYYRTYAPESGMIWKKLPLGKTDKNGKLAQTIGIN